MAVDGTVKSVCMDADEVERSLTRMAHQILEKNKGASNIGLAGIVTRGDLLVTVTNSDAEEHFDLGLSGTYKGALHGKEIVPENGRLSFSLEGNSAEIWIPAE